MTTKQIVLAVATLVLVIGGVAIYQGNGSEPTIAGTTEFQKKSFVEGFFAGTGRQIEATRSGDLTVGGGTLDVTTSNTATSTIIGGCFQFYATSTATAHKFQASTTPGNMVSQYGTCPNG